MRKRATVRLSQRDSLFSDNSRSGKHCFRSKSKCPVRFSNSLSGSGSSAGVLVGDGRWITVRWITVVSVTRVRRSTDDRAEDAHAKLPKLLIGFIERIQMAHAAHHREENAVHMLGDQRCVHDSQKRRRIHKDKVILFLQVLEGRA